MRFTTIEQVSRLVQQEAEETTALEFKQELTVASRVEKKETLKDLTGMANGGGGTILYGVAERDGGVADSIKPLTNRTVIGSLLDVARDAVRPPLLMGCSVIDVQGGGFVLAVDVEHSLLGPNMVEGYGEHRFYVRSGTSTHPMTEQQVRDAYALRSRWQEQRAATWSDHRLPMEPLGGGSCLVVSAVPQEPLGELLDLRAVEATDLRPDEPLLGYLRNGGPGRALDRLARWADGFHGGGGSSAPDSAIRVHRDGSAGFAATLVSPDMSHQMATADRDGADVVRSTAVPLALNGQLAYLGWIWGKFGLGRPVELHIEVTGLTASDVARPHGIPVDSISEDVQVLPHELVSAGERHQIVRAFTDRAAHAYGDRRSRWLFEVGHLYGRDGRLTGVTLGDGTIWDEEQRQQRARVGDGGVVWATTRPGPIGFEIDGILVDLDGHTIATLAFAPSRACPPGFLPLEWPMNPRPTAGSTPASVEPEPTPVPEPTGRWAPKSLREVLDEARVPLRG